MICILSDHTEDLKISFSTKNVIWKKLFQVISQFRTEGQVETLPSEVHIVVDASIGAVRGVQLHPANISKCFPDIVLWDLQSSF